MAKIDTFEARVPQSGSVSGYVPTGATELFQSIAQASGRIADRLGRKADEAAVREGEAAGQKAALSIAMPSVDFAFDGSSALTTAVKPGKAVKTSDPVAGDLPGYAKAFLNTVAAGESGGAYNVRYTPDGAATFADLSRHPGIMVPGPHGPTSAAGRYQFTKTTWESLGGGSFDPAHQDRMAWKLAERDYKAQTGRSLGADLQKGGLTAGILSTLSGTWRAFGKNTGDLLATYQASAKRYGAGGGSLDPMVTTAVPPAASSTPAGATGNGVHVRIGGGPVTSLPQAPAGTLYGDAFNQAVEQVGANRLQTSLREQMVALSIEHQGDPAGLTEALDAAYASYRSGGDLPPAVAASLDETFQTTRLGLVRVAASDFQRRRAEQWQASFEDEIASRTDNALRLAMRGGTDAAADQALAADVAGIGQTIAASTLSPSQKSRLQHDLVDNVFSARIMGGFSGKATPDERAAYAKQFQEEWQNGKGFGGKLSADAFSKVNSGMLQQLQRDQAAAEKQRAAIGKSIDGQMTFLKKGYPVPPAIETALKKQVDAAGDPQLSDQYRFFSNLADWQRAHLTAKPEVLAAQADALRKKIDQDGATEGALTTLDVVTSLHDNMVKALDTDPLTFADRAGIIKLAPIDFSSADGLTASLTERASDAHAVASHYGRQAKFFTAAEVDALKKAATTDPLALPQFASSIVSAFGSDTPAALSEISKDAPVIAHIAGLYQATGDQRLLVEAGQALAMRNMEGYQSILPPRSKIAQTTAGMLAGALAALPKTAIAAADTASLVFEERARREGLMMDDFDMASSPARALYGEVLNEALGATIRNGVTYGGLGEVNGHATIVPVDMTADQLENAIDNLSAADMASQAPIGTANGIPISAADIRGGTLVYVAPGRYRVALGDPASDNPRYVPSAAGGYFTLDVGVLRKWRQESRMPVISPPAPALLLGP